MSNGSFLSLHNYPLQEFRNLSALFPEQAPVVHQDIVAGTFPHPVHDGKAQALGGDSFPQDHIHLLPVEFPQLRV